MKNKILMRITTALFAALILMGGFSIPAYANGGGEATNDSNVKTEEKKEEKTEAKAVSVPGGQAYPGGS